MDFQTLDDAEFTIFDTETTGLSAVSGDRIVEIAGVRCRGGQALGAFESLVNPRREISEGAKRVHGITEEMLKDAPGSDEVLPKFLAFAQGSCLCAYNAPFDLDFLFVESQASGIALSPDLAVVDVLAMSRRLFPSFERHSLSCVAEQLGISTPQEHRAMADVQLTLQVFTRCLDELKQKGVTQWREFMSLFGIRSPMIGDMQSHKIAEIQQAIDVGFAVRIRYFSGTDASVTQREIVPEAIKYEGRHAYVQGFCRLRQERRTFRIDAILGLETA